MSAYALRFARGRRAPEWVGVSRDALCSAAAQCAYAHGEAKCSDAGQTRLRGFPAPRRGDRTQSANGDIVGAPEPESRHGGPWKARLLTSESGGSAYDDTGAKSPNAASCAPLSATLPAKPWPWGAERRGLGHASAASRSVSPPRPRPEARAQAIRPRSADTVPGGRRLERGS